MVFTSAKRSPWPSSYGEKCPQDPDQGSTSAKRSPWPSSYGEKCPQDPDQGSTGGVHHQLPSSEPGIGAHELHRMQMHCHGAAFSFQLSATLAEPAGYAVAIGSKRTGKMQHY
ncbi:hypothetical protein QE152_g9343 [Popillia japonica]|uniref:Uncharacterized protein n=1 Tax=Popillia japonica TaxID=7064 RepID=A0AAW1LYT4_POPJA